MKFSYITLTRSPLSCRRQCSARGGAGDYDHELCCAYVDYPTFRTVMTAMITATTITTTYTNHDDGGVGHRCFRRYDDWCEFERLLTVSATIPYDETASGCFSVDDDYGKAGKARKAGMQEGREGGEDAQDVKTVKAAKAA
ncbi:hypothetical protein APHAL10511_000714 [Amanita phalloides]|nr:hypothetical protein APHAL10511_000714 [Amanita phalloides]